MKPLKLLTVGDIHCKPRIITWVKNHLSDYDKVVFLGDYVDDWDTPPELSYNTLKQLIDLKLKHPSKIEANLGNHDLHYLLNDPAHRYSGWNPLTSSLIKDLYKTKTETNTPVFQVAYSKGNYLFTHAGVDERWFNDLKLLLERKYPDLLKLLNSKEGTLAARISNILNYGFLEWLNGESKLFYALTMCGPYRGGTDNPSPLWADYDDIYTDKHALPKLNQVIGHTPVKTILTRETKDKKHLYFCDTFSEDFLPFVGFTIPHGDNTFLELTFYANGRVKPNVLGLD